VAVGAQGSARLRAEGEDLQNVDAAVDFLRDFNLGKQPRVGRRVAVVGGGNSAIDASRCALRLGAAEVTLLYRRLRQDMPAQEEEIRAAEQEGVRIECLVAPARFLGDSGRVQKVVCQRMALAEFDASGRRRPVPVAGDQFSLDVDHVLVAIGQATDLGFIGMNGDIRVTKGGLIEIMAGTRTRASQAMIFAGGDVVSGPATVVKAIAAGRRAAAEIDSAIRRRHNEPPYVPPAEEAIEIPRLVDEEVRERPRASMPEAPAAERIRDFLEVELGFSQDVAMQEACRCLRCDLTGEEG